MAGHNPHGDFKFLHIEKINSKDTFVRKARESMWNLKTKGH